MHLAIHCVTAIINNSSFAWLFMARAKLPVRAALDYMNILNVTFNIGNLEPLNTAAQIKSS